jgi:hypothetical protein
MMQSNLLAAISAVHGKGRVGLPNQRDCTLQYIAVQYSPLWMWSAEEMARTRISPTVLQLYFLTNYTNCHMHPFMQRPQAGLGHSAITSPAWVCDKGHNDAEYKSSLCMTRARKHSMTVYNNISDIIHRVTVLNTSDSA